MARRATFVRRDPASTHSLSDDEARRLVNACDPAFRLLVQAAYLTANVRHRLTGDTVHDQSVIDEAVEEQVLAVGRANVSRAISDLVKAGFLTRYYAGYAANHTRPR